MTTTMERPAVAPPPTVSHAARDERRAGLALAGSGVAMMLGIMTAEALYPGTYTTHANMISDLGGTEPPNSVVLQPSATIFDVTMVVTGIAIVLGAFFLSRSLGRRGVTIATALLGVGVLGVGVFPGDTGQIHMWFALLAFTSGGVAAVASSGVTTQPMRSLAPVLGAVALAMFLATFFHGGSTPLPDLGDGGAERWIGYPVILWLTLFGGWLMGSARNTDRTRSEAQG
ncbi:MAG: DUF998 domain-containing protein [Actinomycetota bacterium]